MDREKLIDQILAARTDDEITSAQAAARSYLATNPDDDGVRVAMEQLALMKSASR